MIVKFSKSAKFFGRWFARAAVFSLFLASLARAEIYPFKVYTSAEGLIYESVRCLYQDSRGLIWFCTPIGVSRFDGYQFTNYSIEEGLSNPGITDIVEGEAGVFWFGSVESGVFRFDARAGTKMSDALPKFVHFRINPDAPDNVVRFFKNRRGQIYAATESGLFMLDDRREDNKFSRVELKIPGVPENEIFVSSLTEDAAGNLWIGHRFGLTRLAAGGASIHYEVQPNGATDWARAVFVDAENRVWIVTDRRSLMIFKPEPSAAPAAENTKLRIRVQAENSWTGKLAGGEAYLFKTEESLADGAFGAIGGTSDGKIWIATNGRGLIEFDGANFRSYTKENGLCDDRTQTLLEDRFGNLWIGTAWGAMKLPRQGFVNYKTEDGLADLQVMDIFADQAGVPYAVNRDWKINRFDGTRFFSTSPNLPKDIGRWRYHDILLDRAGDWWIGTPKGLFRFSKVEKIDELAAARPAAVYNRENGLPSEDIFALFEDARGDVWLSYWSSITGHLTRWERESGKFHHYDARDGIPPDCFPSYFREDAQGNVFIGCRTDKIIIYTGNRFLSFSADARLKDKTIHDILVDSKNRLWIGMGAGGLRRIDQPLTENAEIRSYTIADGVSEIHIQYLVEDAFGKIYFVTARSMDRLDPETGEIKHFTLADGLAAAGTGKAIRDRQGTLWLATARGVSKFAPAPEKDFPPPPVFISRLRVAGKEMPLAALGETEISGFVLEPDEKQVQIDFYAVNLASGEALRYQYKLGEAEWSEPAPQRSVTLNLSPGVYDFQIRAVASDGNAGQNPSIVSFTILRPVWQRWWFLILAVAVASFLIYAVYRYRLRRLIELERVRTRIATDLHDDIGSSLSQIAILSEVARQKIGANGASEPLNMIADTSREMVDSMSDIVWAINPQKDHLSDLIQRMRRFAEDMLDAQNIAYRFIVPENAKKASVGADFRREVYLIFKETVNNLVKHSAASEAVFEIRLENENLTIEIRDDGRGFDQEKLLHESFVPGFGGNGLTNMSRRAANLDGVLTIDSELEKGTRVILSVPLKKDFRF